MTIEKHAIRSGRSNETPSGKPSETPSETPGKKAEPGGVRAAFICHMYIMGSTTLWFLGILALITLLFNATSVLFDWPGWNGLLSYSLLITVASPVFLLVMGIVMPSYLESMLSFGATRKQHALALLLTGMAVTAGLALISSIMIVIIKQFNLDPAVVDLTYLTYPQLLSFFLQDCLFFLTGWFIVIGYQYRRVFTAFLSTLIGPVLLLSRDSWNWLFSQSSLVTSGMANSGLLRTISEGGILADLISTAILVAILLPAILALTRRIPIKV
ncbi:MAG: hypothetical protein LBK67_00565 [Coriobacteriales bacterium]|jgi:hypothetical protein|nr:hypothetical protein [Coriobacteriales bacterium]